jgi:hypothetical protein
MFRKLSLVFLPFLLILGWVALESVLTAEKSGPTCQDAWGIASFDLPILAMGDRVSLSEGQRRVPFAIPLPSSMPASANLQEIYVSPADTLPQDRWVALLYSNGVQIFISQSSVPLNWEALRAEDPQLIHPILVKGQQGQGVEPGLLTKCITHYYSPSDPGETRCEEGPEHRPGHVMWQIQGLLIEVSSYNHSMQELLHIAESIPTP